MTVCIIILLVYMHNHSLPLFLKYHLSIPYSVCNSLHLHPMEVFQFSRSVVSDSLQPHESQLARPPCPSPTSGVHSNSHPSSRLCHPAISSSVVPLSSCPQSLPASESLLLPNCKGQKVKKLRAQSPLWGSSTRKWQKWNSNTGLLTS